MNREIKFRAWDALYDKMLYSNKGNLSSFFHAVEQRPKDQAPVMQSTGLYDKNGREIYEGDIIRRYGVRELLIIEWRQHGAFRAVSKDHSAGDWYFDNPAENDIMGTIFENPELLK